MSDSNMSSDRPELASWLLQGLLVGLGVSAILIAMIFLVVR